MSPHASRHARFALLTLAALALDLITKALARASLGPVGSGLRRHIFGERFYLELRENPGVAFSLLRDLPQGRYLLSLFGLVAIGFLLVWWVRHAERRPLVTIYAALFCSGALGNTLDRLVRGRVTDFLRVDLDFAPFDPWPAFNVADIAIVAGVIAFLSVLERRGAAGPA